MVYELRRRKEKLIYYHDWSSTSESGSESDDPNYTRTPQRRRTQSIHIDTNVDQIAEVGAATSSSGDLARRKPGRPPKRMASELDMPGVQLVPKRTRRKREAPCSLTNRAGSSKNPTENHVEPHARQLAGDLESQNGFNYIKLQTADKNDDTCIICADGGELLCCETCPSAFHPTCMNMKRVPEGEWFCPYCVCKFCGLAGDPDDENILICSLCRKKFHLSCYGHNQIDLNLQTSSFCGERCQEISEKLEKLVGMKNELDQGYSWTLLHQTDVSSSIEHSENLHQKVQGESKISVAWVMMDQCFETIIDRYTGINVVHSVVYNRGSNLSRINFTGFYTAVLEKDDEIISAASIRIHGAEIAEMPFVGTKMKYRGNGLLRKLLSAIESVLGFLKVENLVIPSATEVVGMWIKKFNFSHIGSALMEEIISLNTLMFPRAVRLQKSLLEHAAEAEFAAMEDVNDVQNDDPNNVVQQTAPQRPPPFDLNLEPPNEDGDIVKGYPPPISRII